MSLFKKLINIFTSGEVRIFNTLAQHIQYSINSIEILLNALKSKSTNNLHQISKLEKDGDELIRKLYEDVLKGAINFKTLTIVEILVNKVDDILDKIHAASREVERILKYLSKDFLLQLFDYEIYHMLSACYQSLKILKNMFENIQNLNTKSLKDKIFEIERGEEKVDEIKNQVIDFLYINNQLITHLELISIMNLVYLIDSIIDYVKDVSLLTLIIYSSIS